ncbi:MAG: hypothetical protein ACERKZ_02345 [Lachnotalea sp.]
MAQKILVMGESGTGKTTSMRNFNPDELAIVNPVGKSLPFRGKFEMLNGETESRKIVKFMKDVVAKGKKKIVVDDFQYILSIPYMNRIKEAGWDKWNDFGANYFDIIDICDLLPDDVTVYYMTHTETLENGITTIKLIGKLLREKITIEGLFTTVLRTSVVDSQYYFLTQNSGKDTVKTPMGMFPSYAIDNDLKYVDDKIRNYYEIGEFKPNEEIEKADKEVSKDLVKPDNKGRRARNSTTEQTKEQEAKEPRRRSRSEVQDDNNKKVADYMEKSNKAIEEVAGDREEIPFEEVPDIKAPELETPPRRTRSEREADEQPKQADAPASRTRKSRETVQETKQEETQSVVSEESNTRRRRTR